MRIGVGSNDAGNLRADPVHQRLWQPLACLAIGRSGELPSRGGRQMPHLVAGTIAVQDLLKQRSAAEETQLQSLVKIYENMKPKAAAGVFEELDMDILLEVVSRMKERKVAPILALMTPTRAKELTFEPAQRQQLPVAP